MALLWERYRRQILVTLALLAALGWLLGPWGLLAGTVLATGILIRREFASHSRQVILRRAP